MTEQSGVNAPIPISQPASTKAATVNKLLLRSKGATLAEVSVATDWQRHSVRAYFTGLRKKGHHLVRECRASGETSWRIER